MSMVDHGDLWMRRDNTLHVIALFALFIRPIIITTKTRVNVKDTKKMAALMIPETLPTVRSIAETEMDDGDLLFSGTMGN